MNALCVLVAGLISCSGVGCLGEFTPTLALPLRGMGFLLGGGGRAGLDCMGGWLGWGAVIGGLGFGGFGRWWLFGASSRALGAFGFGARVRIGRGSGGWRGGRSCLGG